MASEYDVLVPGTKAFFDCFCSEVWVGSCFLLGLDSSTKITSSLLETFALLSLPDVLLFLFLRTDKLSLTLIHVFDRVSLWFYFAGWCQT